MSDAGTGKTTSGDTASGDSATSGDTASQNTASENTASENKGTGEPASGSVSVAHMAALHGALALGLLALFAVADTWVSLTALPLAGGFSVMAGLLAGFLLATLIHEWFHFFGTLGCGGSYQPVTRPGLFAFNWNFGANTTRQFLFMSVAGSVGSVLAVLLFSTTVPADAPGRVALLAAAWGSLVFAALIEWPVLYRVWRGAAPLAALGAIDHSVVLRAGALSALAIIATARLLAT